MNKDKLINWEELKEKYGLEDFYNILCRNEPHKNSKIHEEWSVIESIAYEELLIEDERPRECEYLIDKIIDFLKGQRKTRGIL